MKAIAVIHTAFDWLLAFGVALIFLASALILG